MTAQRPLTAAELAMCEREGIPPASFQAAKQSEHFLRACGLKPQRQGR